MNAHFLTTQDLSTFCPFDRDFFNSDLPVQDLLLPESRLTTTLEVGVKNTCVLGRRPQTWSEDPNLMDHFLWMVMTPEELRNLQTSGRVELRGHYYFMNWHQLPKYAFGQFTHLLADFTEINPYFLEVTSQPETQHPFHFVGLRFDKGRMLQHLVRQELNSYNRLYFDYNIYFNVTYNLTPAELDQHFVVNFDTSYGALHEALESATLWRYYSLLEDSNFMAERNFNQSSWVGHFRRQFAEEHPTSAWTSRIQALRDFFARFRA